MATEPKILIVEDEKPMSRALELKFSHSGFITAVAGDGEEALAKILNDKFDIVLLDLILPRLDGFGVLEALQKKGVKVKVVVTSNLGQEEDKKRAESLGASAYYVKSNTPISTLVENIKKLVGV